MQSMIPLNKNLKTNENVYQLIDESIYWLN